MRYFLFISLFYLLAFPSLGQSQETLLKCLGNEELMIHRKKLSGPLYELNQLFINELASTSDVELKRYYLEEVCNNKDFSPSVALLRLLLLNGDTVFQYNFNDMTKNLRSYKVAEIQDLLARLPHIFFKYLSHLQSLAPTADCLTKEVPEVNYFLDRFKYLEENYSSEKLLSDKQKLHSIFERLKGLDAIFQKCQKRKDQEMEEKKLSQNKS